MARNIVDTADRTVSIPIRKFNPKWLLIALVIVCVIGGSVGGYYAFNKATPTTTVQKPPVQPNPVPPVTSTPTQPTTPTPTPMPVLEVKWEEIKLPPLKSGFDDIIGFKVENGGKTISVYRAIGPAENGKATSYSLWRTSDGANTWKEVEQGVIHETPPEWIPMVTPKSDNSLKPPLSEEEILKNPINPITDLAVCRQAQDKDNIFVFTENVPNIIFMQNAPESMDGFWEIRQLDGLWKKQEGFRNLPPTGYSSNEDFLRLFLSKDRGQSWYQLNFPPLWTSLDAYPETPELTFLRGSVGLFSMIDVISSGEGSINLYIVYERGSFLKATIKSPN